MRFLSSFRSLLFLLLLTGCVPKTEALPPGSLSASWSARDGLQDERGILGYVGEEGENLRFEFTPGYADEGQPMLLQLKAVQGGEGKEPHLATKEGARVEVPWRWRGRVLSLQIPPGSGVFSLEVPRGSLESLALEYIAPGNYPEPLADATPKVAEPAGRRHKGVLSCERLGNTAVLQNEALRAVFSLSPHFALTSLKVAEAGDAEVLANPSETCLLRLEVNGRMHDLSEAQVERVGVEDDTLRVFFRWKEPAVSGMMEVVCQQEELSFRTTLRNASPASQSLKIVFPHFGGLRLSGETKDDYYFFPYSGGMVATHPLDWRDNFGDGRVLHQFLDVFSPSLGAGIYLRVEDAVGKFKTFSMKKGGKATPGYTHPIYPWPGILDLARMVSRPLEDTRYTAFSIDYQQMDRNPGEEYVLPPACLGTHGGSWKNGFRRYAQWVRKVSPPRPFPSPLTDRWNLRAGFGLASPLLNNEELDRSYIGRYERNGVSPGDIIEMVGWWTIGRTAPFEVPLDQDEILGEAYWRVPRWVDPATGTLAYSYHLGDYEEYNPQWGGLPRLREHIDRIRKADQLPIFYLTPNGISAGTRAARRWIPKYAVINPAFRNPLPTPVDPKEPEGIVLNYMKYCPCLDNEEYMDYLAETVARVCRETGIDGFRLDELGGPGYLCLSKSHRHLFAEYGNTEGMAAQREIARRVHQAMDQVRPDLVLLTEFPGNDLLASQIEGALTYDCQNDIKNPVRPAPINVSREFFPECKQFEIDTEEDSQSRWKYWFWNANGTYNSCYAEPIRQLLMKNRDAFAFGKVTVLEDGFPAGVYVNRFEGANGRFVRNLLNVLTTTRQVDIPVRPGWRYVELLSGEILEPKDGKVTCLLRPKAILSVAEEPL